MRKYKTFLFIFFVLALFSFSACKTKTSTDVMLEDDSTSDVDKEADSLLKELNETEQLEEELRSPDLDLDVDF